MWIKQGGPVTWPEQSFDLISTDFYLWGYLKNVVYERELTIREDMIQRIKIALTNILLAALLETVSHFEQRIALCIQKNENDFEHFLFIQNREKRGNSS